MNKNLSWKLIGGVTLAAALAGPLAEARTKKEKKEEEQAAKEAKKSEGSSTSKGGPYSGPEGWLSSSANEKIWSEYCTGNVDEAEVPGVNYSNKYVMNAAKNISKVSDIKLFFYGPVMQAYGLGTNGDVKDRRPEIAKAENITTRAHAFLTLLCGEFRDRASLVEQKVRWLNRMVVLPVVPAAQIATEKTSGRAFDVSKNPWSQMRADDYSSYLEFSNGLWAARRKAQGSKARFDLGENEVDAPVDGTTVCATKHIFNDYLVKGKSFPGLSKFEASLKSFANANCSSDDIDTYYDFRGDSNFKPNSPESNGMIWFSVSVAGQCEGLDKAKGDSKLKDSDCREYFTHPFRSRWNAARAGLATWLLRSKEHDDAFASEGSQVTIYANLNGDKAPFPFGTAEEQQKQSEWLSEFSELKGAYSLPDFGMNKFAKLGSSSPKIDFAYERLRDAVNRHTDWYHSAYDDGFGKVRNEAYSPFVASSYEMSASDGFAQPGATVQSPGDGRKHWMFVFKVKKDDWYHTNRLKNGDKVDFDRMWFDETSLGENELANSERAWDRLGSPLEGEFDTILYLHNVTTSGTPVDLAKALK